MSHPCTRPECGAQLHTDPWGVPVQCPHTEPVADTGRRCPRCDCPDGHEQCEHCKVCPHAGGSCTDPDDDARARAEKAEAAITRVREVLAERLAEVAEREADGMLPFGTPGASWCDAVTVTCARIEDALRPKTAATGVPAEPDPQEAP